MDSVEHFEYLTLEQKAELLWARGKYLDSIAYYGYRVNLYCIGSSLVELYYSPTANRIEKIQIVDDNALTKYAARITLVDLN